MRVCEVMCACVWVDVDVWVCGCEGDIDLTHGILLYLMHFSLTLGAHAQRGLRCLVCVSVCVCVCLLLKILSDFL